MNTLLHRDNDDDVEDTDYGRGNSRAGQGRAGQGRAGQGKDREITLGTTMVLGIFFALAVFGAVFFGFGYSLGSKRAAMPATTQAEGNPSTPFNSFKPAPGNPLGAPSHTGPVPASTTPLPVPVPPAHAAAHGVPASAGGKKRLPRPL